MLTMTRIPSDSFLPSGAMLDPNPHQHPFGAHVNGHSSSVVSPLSLPNPVSSLPFLDDSRPAGMPPPNYHHPTSIHGAPRPQQYLSPDPSPPTLGDPRSAGLPSTSTQSKSAIGSPNMPPTGHTSFVSPLEAMSAQSAAALLQRREEHSRRLLESWQAERAHLEASRARAEEMFREERDLMDHERMMWVGEKMKLENDILEWKRRAEMAESERDQLAKLVRGANISGQVFDGAAEVMTGMRGGNSGSPGTGPPTSIKHRSPSERLSPSIGLGPTMPESHPFVPLDPRMQGPSPGTVSPTAEERVPSIDIHEVIPGLEGIRLKKPAVQKSTFVDGKTSPPPPEPQRSSTPPSSNSPSSQSKTIATELTKETLRAPEARRLIMHAGHTPNHSVSLSRIQTTESTKTPNTADSSGTATPTPQMTGSQSDISSLTEHQQLTENDAAPEPSGEAPAQEASEISEQPTLEPSDEEPVLQGPLHLKNRPAADELFLQKVYDKLEHVKANNVRPSVLDDAESDVTQDTTESESGDIHSPEDSTEDIEEEIPLKFKRSNNFGQPLGKLGSSIGF
ncbi:hypothetical protein F5X96DRAFT_256255 [Biscogniauxia mediterranea]|nr:hypothetical protein F5X96DRAFT_256255 [Biscogniauxia mediterranea]